MKSFVKVEVGSRVFDSVQEIDGIVKSIDYRTNTAELVTGSPSQEGTATSKLFNLTVINKEVNKLKYNNNKWYEQVKEFHLAFKHPVADHPTPLTLERATDRSVWIVEEILEHLQQSSGNKEQFEESYTRLLQGMEKAKEKSLKDDFHSDGTKRIVGQADALIDAVYFIMGSLVEMNIEPDPLFNIVQDANMSKLFTAEDGTKYAKYREEDGKILKSPEFFSPEPLLEEEVLRQMNSDK